MILKLRVSLAFLKKNPASKFIFGSTVLNLLKLNAAKFPNLPVSLATLQADNDALKGGIVAAATGDKEAKAELKNIVDDWNDDFRETANFISQQANGSAELISMAGFVATKRESTPLQQAGACKNFSAAPQKAKGRLTAGCATMENAAAFIYLALPEGATVMQNGNRLTITMGGNTMYLVADTHRKVVMENLPGKQPLNVSMFAFNRAGAGPLTSSQEVTPQ